MFDADNIFTQALTLTEVVRMQEIGMPATPQNIGYALKLLYHVACVDTTPYNCPVPKEMLADILIEQMAKGVLVGRRIELDDPESDYDRERSSAFPIPFYRGRHLANTMEFQLGEHGLEVLDYIGEMVEPYSGAIQFVISEMAFAGSAQLRQVVEVADAEWDAMYLEYYDTDESVFDLVEYTVDNLRLDRNDADEGFTELIHLRVKWEDLISWDVSGTGDVQPTARFA